MGRLAATNPAKPGRSPKLNKRVCSGGLRKSRLPDSSEDFENCTLVGCDFRNPAEPRTSPKEPLINWRCSGW
jgi:hypothetical protein